MRRVVPQQNYYRRLKATFLAEPKGLSDQNGAQFTCALKQHVAGERIPTRTQPSLIITVNCPPPHPRKANPLALKRSTHSHEKYVHKHVIYPISEPQSRRGWAICDVVCGCKQKKKHAQNMRACVRVHVKVACAPRSRPFAQQKRATHEPTNPPKKKRHIHTSSVHFENVSLLMLMSRWATQH